MIYKSQFWKKKYPMTGFVVQGHIDLMYNKQKYK